MNLQLIHPEMLPFIQSILVLFGGLLGIIGSQLIIGGCRSWKKENKSIQSKIKLGIGILIISFLSYNSIGYYRIYKAKEQLILGQFKSNDSKTKLHVYSDKTWKLVENNNKFTKTGKWGFDLSEDGCFWNFQTDDGQWQIQTRSYCQIHFKSQDILFQKF